LALCVVCHKQELWGGLIRQQACKQYLVPLSTRQVAVGTCGIPLPICTKWSDLLLFLPGCSCIALLLQFCLVSSSLSKVEQFNFEYHLQSQETTLAICHASALGGWLVTPHLLSAFVPHPAFACWVFSSSGRLACLPTPALSACSSPCSCLSSLRVQLLALPPFSEVGSAFHPTPTVSGRLQFTVYVSQFCSGVIQSAQGLHWFILLGDGWESSMWCMVPTCWVCRFTQADLKLAGREKWHATFLKTLTGTGFSLVGHG
jgi:hypothetical protein